MMSGQRRGLELYAHYSPNYMHTIHLNVQARNARRL